MKLPSCQGSGIYGKMGKNQEETDMKIAIVTGASSGMGREFVRQLSGFVDVDEIWAVARREEALQQLRKEVAVPVRPVVLDLLQPDSFRKMEEMLYSAMEDFKLDIAPDVDSTASFVAGETVTTKEKPVSSKVSADM